ncbi:photoreceptor cilium actin regulator-like [Pantherophis guttatus]|uniref:Photoreceptor cilium actin regulator-like n=1 Tax=Pantherophis guttatus TaxID=94885 RepID=A0A6P9D2H3_PANGU|nr:photoreceptor cilium actin regulator-like [Pantherophis guttatus]
MALADFHYTTGISSGFKVYILEGHSSFENEQRFHRLPAYRLPTCPIKRKANLDVRRIPEGQKASKVRRLSCRPIAADSPDQVAPPASVPVAPIAVSCVSTSSTATCRDSHGLLPSCAQKCPPKEPVSEPVLTVAQLQQMRPSVITCAPRRSCPEAPPSPNSPLSPAKQNNVTSNFPRSQRLCPWTTSISASFSREASPRQTIKEADGNL